MHTWTSNSHASYLLTETATHTQNPCSHPKQRHTPKTFIYTQTPTIKSFPPPHTNPFTLIDKDEESGNDWVYKLLIHSASTTRPDRSTTKSRLLCTLRCRNMYGNNVHTHSPMGLRGGTQRALESELRCPARVPQPDFPQACHSLLHPFTHSHLPQIRVDLIGTRSPSLSPTPLP